MDYFDYPGDREPFGGEAAPTTSQDPSSSGSNMKSRIGKPVNDDTFKLAMVGHENFIGCRLKQKRGSKSLNDFARRDYCCATHTNCPFQMIVRVYNDQPSMFYMEVKKMHDHKEGKKNFVREPESVSLRDYESRFLKKTPSSLTPEERKNILFKHLSGCGWVDQNGKLSDPIYVITGQKTMESLETEPPHSCLAPKKNIVKYITDSSLMMRIFEERHNSKKYWDKVDKGEYGEEFLTLDKSCLAKEAKENLIGCGQRNKDFIVKHGGVRSLFMYSDTDSDHSHRKEKMDATGLKVTNETQGAEHQHKNHERGSSMPTKPNIGMSAKIPRIKSPDSKRRPTTEGQAMVEYSTGNPNNKRNNPKGVTEKGKADLSVKDKEERVKITRASTAEVGVMQVSEEQRIIDSDMKHFMDVLQNQNPSTVRWRNLHRNHGGAEGLQQRGDQRGREPLLRPREKVGVRETTNNAALTQTDNSNTITNRPLPRKRKPPYNENTTCQGLHEGNSRPDLFHIRLGSGSVGVANLNTAEIPELYEPSVESNLTHVNELAGERLEEVTQNVGDGGGVVTNTSILAPTPGSLNKHAKRKVVGKTQPSGLPVSIREPDPAMKVRETHEAEGGRELKVEGKTKFHRHHLYVDVKYLEEQGYLFAPDDFLEDEQLFKMCRDEGRKKRYSINMRSSGYPSSDPRKGVPRFNGEAVTLATSEVPTGCPKYDLFTGLRL